MDKIEDDLVQRRLQTIYDEAVCPDGAACKPIRMMMRHLSNYYSVGRYRLESSGVKRLNKLLSDGALKLLRECADEKEWNKKTDNEHPLPVKDFWRQIVDGQLSPDQIAQGFRSYPMVTVTKEEHRGLKKNLPPKERYAQIARHRLTLKPIDLLRIPDLAERRRKMQWAPEPWP